jgi:hypothetical protein
MDETISEYNKIKENGPPKTPTKLTNGLPSTPPKTPESGSGEDSRQITPTAKTDSPITLADVKGFAKKRINGREVKMLVRAAQAIARNQKRPLNAEHIHKVLKVQEAVRDVHSFSLTLLLQYINVFNFSAGYLSVHERFPRRKPR